MAGQKFTLTFDANLEVSKMKGALGDIQKSLNGLQLPQNVTKGLQGTFQKLSEEIRNFEVQAGKDITGKADFSKLEKSADKINGLFEKLRIQIKDLGNLSSKDLEKLLPESVTRNIDAANNALKTYNNTLKTIQGTIDDANNKIADQQNKLQSYQAAIQQLIANKSSKVYDSLKQTIQDSDGTTRFETEAEALQRLKKAYDSVNDSLQKYQAKVGQNPTAGQQTYITRLTNQLKQLDKAYKDLEQEGNKNLQLDTQIKALETSSKSAQTQITKLQANLQTLLQGKQGQEAQALQTLLNSLQQIQGIDFSKFSQDAQGAGNAVQQYLNENLQKLISNLQSTEGEVGQQGPVFNNFRQQVQQAGTELTNFDNQMREVESLKSRIQYFFGLNNTIQLVKRTMRDAYNTVKELDKAMTETAVVTDFSVGDMWSQLPEYTKRANELGVTTKAAYEAATLYYQQGLKTNEVMAISNETLKMARIAGLDAAVATDRMTNAVRGFNMEINEANTQRVNDVYSQLAAITASDVDEISTAMTKVASLAHNAGMEFETTAAFLAQIIETTRESAETAGTALKTVVARFAEVKELYNKDELEGTDEEGEIIDVNKVSKALRTAGIDMNRYFLGEVGIDDIFLELAEKWDSLTTLQQRYIATQAAGSRQQSRFIALMSDYARTQELVGEAYNANGASAKQFEKTQESLESKLARLKNAWDEFAMGIANSDLVKLGVDALTGLLNVINSLTSGFGALDTGAGKFINTFAKLALLIGGLKVGKGLTAGLFGSMLGAVTGGTIGGSFNSIAASAMGVAPGRNLLTTLGTGAISPFGFLGGLSSNIAKFKQGSAITASNWMLDPSYLAARQQYRAAPSMSNLQALGKVRQGAIRNATVAPKTLFGALGNRFVGTKVGGAISTGLGGALGKLGIGGGAALGGAATLGAALAGIAAAAGTAYVAIKRIYDLSPSGQVKIAEKYANSLQIAADAAKKTQNEFESVQEEYNRLNQNISEATTFEERTEAIKSRTEYVQSLLEQNATYAQYIEDFKVENGELLLTLDSDKLAQACEEIARTAIKAQSGQDIGNANLAFQQYQKASRDVEKLSNQKNYFLQEGLEDQWTNELEASLVSATARQQAFLKQYQSYATQGAIGQLGDEELSDVAESFLINVVGQMFNGDEVANIFEEESTKFFGLITSLKGSGLITTLKEAQQAYQDAFLTTIIPEDIKDDKDALIKAIAGERARQQLESGNKDLIDAFLKLTPEYQEILADLLINNGANIKNSDREKLYGSLDTTFSEVFQYLNNELQEQLWTSVKRIQLPVNTDIISKVYEPNGNLNSEYNKIYETARNFAIDPRNDLTENQSAYLTTLLTDFAKDNYDSLDEFSNFLDKLFKATNSKDLDDLFNALQYLDIDSTQSIENFFGALDELDINFNSFGYSLDEAAQKLIELAGAAKDFNIEDLREKITDNVSLMRDIKDRKSGSAGYRIFSEDEYSLLTGAGINPNQFVYSGIKNKEWTYTGEDLDSLVQALIQNLTLEIEKNSASLDKKIATGQYINDRANQKVTLDGQELSLAEALQQIVDKSSTSTKAENYERLNAEWVRTIIQELYGEHTLSLRPEELIGKIQEALDRFYQLESNTQTKQQIQQYATQPMDYITSINKFRPGINEQDYGTAVSSKFYVDEHAEDRYDQILKSIQEIDAANAAWNKTSEQQETISQALAVNWSEEAAKLEELTEILDKNDKILANSANDSDEYSGAIHAVGEAMRAAYGEQVSDEFVQAHIQQIALARESKEAYQELLDLLQQDFFSNAAQGAEGLAGVLWDVQQQMLNCAETGYALDGLEINGVAVLDDTPWMAIIEELIKAGADVAAFFDTLGWSVVYGPTNKDGIPSSVQLVRNQPTGYGGYQPYTGSNWGRGSTPKGGGGGSGSKEPKREEWKSDFDWLYNLLEDITELERDQKKLQEEQNKILTVGDTSTGRDLYENLIKQLANLELQRQYQSTVQGYRRREMDEFMGVNSAYSRYFRFNDRDQTLEIDWDAINNIGDKETYDKVKELVSEAEKIQDKMDDAEDSVRDVEKQIRDLQNIWREEYADFEQRVLDALVNSYQRIIDNYSDLHNTITDSNNDILEALEREIDLERQIRDNTRTEDEIADAEARLAFLRRDTTGGNQVEILNAQQGLDDTRQAYEDTLVDQAIQRLSQDNQDAALQREKQIELMQAQLDYSVLNGEFNDDVSQLLHEAMGADGQLLTNSNLYELLQQEESWSAMSEVDKAIWEDELNNTFKEVSAFLLKEKSEADGTFAEAIQSEIAAQGGTLDASLQNGLYGIGMSIGSMSQSMDHVTETYDNAVSGLRDANSALANANAALAGMKAENDSLKAAISSISSAQSRNSDSSAYWSRQKDLQHQIVNDLSTAGALQEKFKFKKYATGGLNTSSGPAWLDGTPSKPEYVLNALQTEAFLKLANVLPNIFNNDSGATNNLGTNMYLDFTINVDSLSNDYDVDQLVDRVKEDIYNVASYRNVNVVNFLR